MIALFALASALSCGPTPEPSSTPPTPLPAHVTTAPPRIEMVAGGLEVPWAMAFAPDGRLFVTERPGRIRVIDRNGRLNPSPVHALNDVEHSGETGLTGIALHPRYAENRWLYVAYAASEDTVRIIRFTEQNGRLTDRQVILDDIPGAHIHAGTALSFGSDGKLYATTGDAARREIAQDLGSLGGKTLRLNDDGTVPSDNPFVNRRGARPEIWSYGHRNAQGIAWQPGTGRMWQTDHGPSGFDGPGGGDEVNLVERGKNYGWPVIHHEQTRAGMVAPAVEWTPAVAPSGCAFYSGDRLPAYKGDLFVACLGGRALIRIDFDGSRPVSQERVVTDLGRIRAVAEGPDGALYFSTSNHDGRGSPARNDDRILRIVPAGR